MIYCPLPVLMKLNINGVLFILSKEDLPTFKGLFAMETYIILFSI